MSGVRNDNADIILLLRHAFYKSAHMPASFKKIIISIYLQYLLKDWPVEKVNRFTVFINYLSKRKKKPPIFLGSPTRVSGNSNFDEVNTQRFVKNANSTAKKSNKIPAIEAISRVDMLFHLNDLAMQKAVLSIFNRLLNAMDPEIIKTTVKKKTFSSAIKYQASVYDAYVNKYQRLKIYGDKGKLAIDFRLRFKKYLKEELSKAGEI